MHYYKRNIGDYAKKAGRLSMLEHGAYTLLIDACYDRERFPTEQEAIEWCWARTPEEIAAVRFVLARFFDLSDGVYVQSRIAEEIETYRANSETNRRIATEREEKRKQRARTVHEHPENLHEAPPNQEPKNQEPLNQEPRNQEPGNRKRKAVDVLPDPGFDEFWAAWPRHSRKTEKDKCLAHWKAEKLADQADVILHSLSLWKASAQWTKDSGQFIPAPLVWLRKKSFEAAAPVPATATQPAFDVEKRNREAMALLGFAPVIDLEGA